jgi:hypothetical protein
MRELGQWDEWAKLVLGDIEKLEAKTEEIHKILTEIKVELAILKTKSIFISVVASAFMAIAVGVISTIIANKIGG